MLSLYISKHLKSNSINFRNFNLSDISLKCEHDFDIYSVFHNTVHIVYIDKQSEALLQFH